MIFSANRIQREKNSPLLIFAFFFAVGILGGRFAPFDQPTLHAIFGITLGLSILVRWIHREGFWILFQLLACLAGVIGMKGQTFVPPGGEFFVGEKKNLEIVGEVLSYPERSPDGRFASYLLEVQKIEGKPIGVKVRVSDEGGPYPSRGETILFTGKLRVPRNLGNDLEFDQVLHAQSQGISFFTVLSLGRAWKHVASPNFYWRFFAKLRARMDGILEAYLPTEKIGVFRAMVFGDRLEVDSLTREAYQVSGVMHALVVSGFHVGLIAMAFWMILRSGLRWAPFSYRVLQDWKVKAMGLLLSSLFFHGLSNGSLPTHRALWAAILGIVILSFRKYVRPIDGWALSFTIAMTESPMLLLNLSFLLTFGVVLSLMVFLPRVRTSSIRGWVETHLWVASMASWVALTILWAFTGSMNVGGLLGGLLFSPGFILPIVFGFLATLSMFSPAVSGFFLCCFSQSMEFLDHALFAFRSLVHTFSIGYDPWLFCAWLVLSLAFLLIQKAWVRMSLFCLALILGGAISQMRPTPMFSIHALSVGQGDATLIQSREGKVVLIDNGPKNRRGKTAAEHALLSWMQSHGVGHIDLLVLTHGDADHVSGTETLLRHVPIGEMWTSSWDDSPAVAQIEQLAHAKKIRHRRVSDGAVWGHQQLLIEVIYPLRGGDLSKKARLNAASIVCRIRLGEFRFLALGDLEKEGEKKLTKEGVDLKADWMKVGHHGSKTSTTWSLLDRVRPRGAVISVGWQNPFHHPSETILRRLRVKKVDVFRTDLQGEVRVEIDKDQWKVESFAKSYPTEESFL